MFCPRCGKQVLENEKFCTGCGNALMAIPSKKTNIKLISIIVAAVLFVLTAVIISVAFSKSPEDILIDNKWYTELDVHCEYNDWTSLGDGKGYWFSAICKETVFYLYGETETYTYRIGGYGSVYGPFSYEINSENIPAGIDWKKDNKAYGNSWEILEKNTLKYHGEYYLFDSRKDTRCYCDDSDCRHENTWYITNDYLRIGEDTYVSRKPASLRTEK